MRTKIIAFTGLAGSGKTTAANLLVTRHGWTRASFAEPIRAMLGALGLSRPDMSEGKNIPVPWLGGKTPRALMQSLGTEWGRQFVSPDIWTLIARRQIEHDLATYPGVVIDDCRFENEAAMVRQMGGMVIELSRDGLVRMHHASEQGVPGYLIDALIVNNGITEDELLFEIERHDAHHLI